MSCDHPRQVDPFNDGKTMPCADPACTDGVRGQFLYIILPMATASAAYALKAGRVSADDMVAKQTRFERVRTAEDRWLWLEAT